MKDTPPTPPTASIESRIAALRAELDGDEDPRRRAILHFEVGGLLEQRSGTDAAAVREYLTAFNLDPAFRPPLYALVRVFERRRSFKNLLRLYEVDGKTAPDDAARASASLDLAALLADHLPGQGDPLEHLDAAIGAAKKGAAWSTLLATGAMLERIGRATGDVEVVRRGVAARAEATRGPLLRAMLWIDLARVHAEADPERAIETLREAIDVEGATFLALDAMEEIAREHDLPRALAEALARKANALAVFANGGDVEPEIRHRYDSPEAARAATVPLRFEAATLRAEKLDDLPTATALLTAALEQRPDDLVLHQAMLRLAERSEDHVVAMREIDHLLTSGATGPAAAVLHVRKSQLARAADDLEAAEASLAAAVEAAPNSPVARALWEDLLMDRGDHVQRVADLVARRNEKSGAARAEASWRAGQITAERIGEFSAAVAHYEDAIAHASDPIPIVRELFGAATRADHPQVALEQLGVLISAADDDEKSVLLRERVNLLRRSGDEAGAKRALAAAVSSEVTRLWAPGSARLQAAREGDHALLAAAHEALSTATENKERVAHLVAAARAATRADQLEEAVAFLRSALAQSPGDPYAVALFEEILRSQGDARELVSLLSDAADAGSGIADAEFVLLSAGAAAEAAGDLDLAAETYERAMMRSPDALAPLMSLERLASQREDAALLQRALTGMADREVNAGTPGVATLALAEHHHEIGNDPRRAALGYRNALEDPGEAGLHAACALLLTPSSEANAEGRAAAIDRLLVAAPEDRLNWLPVLARAASSEEVLEEYAEQRPDDMLTLFAQVEHATGAARSDALLNLATVCQGAEVAELTLHALRVKIMSEGSEGIAEAFLVAEEMHETAAQTASLAVAMDETLESGDDPQARIEAVRARLAYSTEATEPELKAALGRASLAGGDADSAFAILRAAVTNDAEDLASWECLRVAARAVAEWQWVVDACDRLAPLASDEQRAMLLEESAAVRIDHLGDLDGGELLLRDALQLDPARTAAYDRLHDLLAERGEAEPLLELVVKRIESVGPEADLARLYFEQARLRRALVDLDGALATIDDLLAIAPEHAGALALAGEIHVSRGTFREAVTSLSRLADSDAPDAQRVVARLGAADFLEKKLSDPAGAIKELERLTELTPDDASVFGRMADVAERAGLYPDAASALDKATAMTAGEERAAFARRAGAIRAEHLSDRPRAIASYRKALEVLPTDADAAESLTSLLSGDERTEFVTTFERGLRDALAEELDPNGLRNLRRSALWNDNDDLASAILETLVVLDVATAEEQSAYRPRAAPIALPKIALGSSQMSALRKSGDGGPEAEFAVVASEFLAVLDELTPTAFSVGRSESISPRTENATREEVVALARVFGVESAEYFVGGDDPGRLAALPGKKGKAQWVLGRSVYAPLSPAARFRLGRQAIAFHRGTLSLIDRSPAAGATLLHAIAKASGAPLSGGAGRASLDTWTEAAQRVMGRRARKTVAAAASALGTGERLESFCAAARFTALRAATLMSGNLSASLELILGERPTLDRVKRSRDAVETVMFWTSPAAARLRTEMGFEP